MSTSKKALRQALTESNAENQLLKHQLREIQVHGWTLQMVCAAVLEKLTDDGALMLTLEERKAAMDGGWGFETQVLEDEAQPMIVRVRKDMPSE